MTSEADEILLDLSNGEGPCVWVWYVASKHSSVATLYHTVGEFPYQILKMLPKTLKLYSFYFTLLLTGFFFLTAKKCILPPTNDGIATITDSRSYVSSEA